MKVSTCPRVEYVKKEFDLEEIANDDDFAACSKKVQKVLHAPKESAIEWLQAAMQGESSCGRDRYGQQKVCHSCYASRLDTKETHRKYNSSDKGKSRLADYRSKLESKPKTSEKLTAKRSAELASKLGCDANNLDKSCLSERQSEVFCMYYGIGREPMSMPAIAEKLGCKKQNVAQLRDYALHQLKKQSQP